MCVCVCVNTIEIIMNCLHCRKERRNDLDTAKAKYYLSIKYLYNKAVTLNNTILLINVVQYNKHYVYSSIY